jgi:hypothetical protein
MGYHGLHLDGFSTKKGGRGGPKYLPLWSCLNMGSKAPIAKILYMLEKMMKKKSDGIPGLQL